MVNRGHDGMQRRHPCGRTGTLARRTAAAPVDDVAEVGTWLDDWMMIFMVISLDLTKQNGDLMVI